ncbi:MAG: hypothetical protein B6U86_00155 [Candidatus Altiarchaeales archaeon ex4484_43]|nr:MAG: hypothetical protein B6U86_00155 [Candidatus Altiarchaeales archaeon ex4484_43]
MKDRLSFIFLFVFVSIIFSFIVVGADIVGNVEITENRTTRGGVVGPISGMQVISADLYPGESIESFIDVVNTLGDTATLRANITGRVRGFIEIKSPVVVLESGERVNLNITFYVPVDAAPGVYSGVLSLKLDGKSTEIPANVRVLPPQQTLFDIKLKLLTDSISPGKKLPVQVTIDNPHGIERNSVLTLQLLDPLTKEVLNESKTFPFIDRTVTFTENLDIPRIEGGKYLIRGALAYEGSANRTEEVEDIQEINVSVSIFESKFAGIPIWVLSVIFFILACSYLGYVLYKRKRAKERRYLAGIDFMSLPRHGKRSAFIGRIAESGIRAFLELDRLTEHVLIAGSTGGGKTVAAQDIVEEALKRNVSVLVFDPTAQWTGFLRPNKEKGMFRLYPKFGMKKKEAQRFDGRIKIVKRPWELNVAEHMKSGEITVFCMNHLNPEDIEDVIIQVILDVFKSRMEEATQLKTLIVFDEVHRLLPKFGGTGRGLIQLERGVREFRKWGIGLVLISQVLTDYPKDIKANVGTEIQMRTRYEGDLSQIKMKYGEDIMKSVVKARVGTGMIQNSQYNRGNPYFVTFRPLLHNPRRLSDKELTLYEKYDLKIEALGLKVKRAKARGVDVFDLELELDLALENLKKGSFEIVDMYLEDLERDIEKLDIKKPINGEIQKSGDWEDEWKRLEEEISK